MAKYTRRGNEAYSIPGSFAKQNLNACPICKTIQEDWLIAYKYISFQKYYLFKCENCGSIFAVSEADIVGLSKTNKSFEGRRKINAGKVGAEIYVRVLEVGLDIRDPELVRLEKRDLPIDELNAYCESVLDESRRE